MTYKKFQQIIWEYYRENPRPMPWRFPWIQSRKNGTIDPYKILVSETMLQQTQVSRVIPKYKSFLKKFPSTKILAKANISDVLIEWQGLGYNRRAKNLQSTAKIIEENYKGKFPQDTSLLLEFPGVGQSTAGALSAFAFNKGIPFIETNIRSVYIHFFFQDSKDIPDKNLLPIIEKTIDHNNPREWFYALMDYGVMLKTTRKDPARRSRHYKKQSKFKGSRREKRSQILTYILQEGTADIHMLNKTIDSGEYNLREIVDQLVSEGLVNKKGRLYIKI